MIHLNYQHLYYFWIVARADSLTAAAKKLKISPSTISTQIKLLENHLNQELFERKSRSLVLTARGKVCLAYADDIFSLGTELLDSMGSGNPNHIYRLRVGVSSHLPKLLTYELLSAGIECGEFPVHLVCTQGDPNALVADLALHHFDIVLSDMAVSLASDLPIESRILGQCNVHLMATPDLAKKFKKDFPYSLRNAPLLLPDPEAKMRQLLEDFFMNMDIHPHVVAELSDSALLKSFGSNGIGLFPVPSIAVPQVKAQYGVEDLGPLEGVKENIYASFSASRQQNPAVQAILDKAEKILLH